MRPLPAHRSKKGFTLIELMLVVAIISLLAAIAIPKFADMIIKAKEAAVLGKLASVRSAALIYYADNPEIENVFSWYVTVNHNFNYLVPRYIDQIPPLKHPTVSDHMEGNGVSTALVDGLWNSGWAYTWNSLGGSSNALPRIYINCTHTNSRGVTWSTF
ncbi:MAG: prepilin-type N-terminal cleavage/methylation domain-containing protein [Elusimicrobia bacterium]|nr:prepilin-type N-terminal cleavage/methylation domain-containing protein [Elusimicrobiota bacterium]